jgi:hypothetical protein
MTARAGRRLGLERKFHCTLEYARPIRSEGGCYSDQTLTSNPGDGTITTCEGAMLWWIIMKITLCLDRVVVTGLFCHWVFQVGFEELDVPS